ncbi:DUF7694 domain-containing protein [Sphingomonas sp.]|uniref:DUF7694 domain-containing protein n=1 Tax=Sphingomonas sp. TaxID=28214 RepID=UPI003AFFDA97
MRPAAAQLREMRRLNMSYPAHLTPVPRAEWPRDPAEFQGGAPRVGLYRSRTHLVQVFAEPGGVLRLSVNRTEWDERRRRFREDISWDDLQRLKAEVGYPDCAAVEVYPPAMRVVNVANMRHLWVLPDAAILPFMWDGVQSRKVVA